MGSSRYQKSLPKIFKFPSTSNYHELAGIKGQRNETSQSGESRIIFRILLPWKLSQLFSTTLTGEFTVYSPSTRNEDARNIRGNFQQATNFTPTAGYNPPGFDQQSYGQPGFDPPGYNQPQPFQPFTEYTGGNVPGGTQKCPKCGRNAHSNLMFCPANSQQCSFCGKFGHFRRCCRLAQNE